jgi:cytochrome c oxidase assembly factor CtaG
VLLAHAGPWVWSVEPLQLAPVVVAAAAYAQRARMLARRGRPVPGPRIAWFALGIALVLVSLVSPVDHLGEERLLTAHMAQHLLLGDLAPLAVVLGLSGPLLRPVLALPAVGRLRVLAHPLVALPLWALNLYVWHLPALYQGALEHDAVHALQHALFFGCGAFMWAAVVEPLPGPAWFGTGSKFLYVVAVRLAGTILANVFIWSAHPFYERYAEAPRTWGLSAAADQSVAGALMMVEGSVVTLAALAWLFLRWAQESELRQELVEAGHDPASVARAVRYGRAALPS